MQSAPTDSQPFRRSGDVAVRRRQRLRNQSLFRFAKIEWVGGFGTVKGPTAIEALMVKSIGSPGKPGGTYHLLTNFIIDVNGDTATAWSRWSFVTPGPDKKPAVAQGGHYQDKLVRENGQWKFSRREAFVDIPAK